MGKGKLRRYPLVFFHIFNYSLCFRLGEARLPGSYRRKFLYNQAVGLYYCPEMDCYARLIKLVKAVEEAEGRTLIET